jgi:DNA-binding HxlR family transcriptional regulator
MTSPRLLWDWGTAYDLFVSLEVLHRPAEFGVRGAWAAGVRARLPATEREILEQSQLLFLGPLHWIYALPDPKDAAAVLWTLRQIPPAERLPDLALAPDKASVEVVETLRRVAARGAWDERDQEILKAMPVCHEEKSSHSPEELVQILDWWSRPEEFGERYLAALYAYQEAFFAEEESRIRPALQEALSRAQELAGRLALSDLLEELSQGLRFGELTGVAELVLAPSFWCTPLVYWGKVGVGRTAWLFGARPPDSSLVPGEVVPDAILRALKALSDPTRLRILHYLTQAPLTPAQLARRLRLRAPTVTHHLNTLRLAGLVQLTLGEGHEVKEYAARSGAIAAAFSSLQDFVDPGRAKDPDQASPDYGRFRNTSGR